MYYLTKEKVIRTNIAQGVQPKIDAIPVVKNKSFYVYMYTHFIYIYIKFSYLVILTGLKTHSLFNFLARLTYVLMMHATQDCPVIQFEVLNNTTRLLCLSPLPKKTYNEGPPTSMF